MKQVLQNPRSGSLQLADVPAPAPERGQILVRNAYSVMSPGTEKLAMDFARSSLLGKARSRPDLVRQVARKLRQEGPLATYRTVVDRLEAPQPLGYATAGVVEAVGAEVFRFRVGDRVACAGAGYANHAELVVVPENLAAHVPDGVPLEAAAFTTLGAIAMQGVRVASPQLGEIAAVVGLGLIGQLAVQLLRANGCRVLGIDVVPRRIEEALRQGTEWALQPDGVPGWSPGAGEPAEVDLAVVAASAKTAAPIQQGAELCRMKGRIAVIGAMPMELDRRTFYAKELELRMSTSYGPGRYDPSYEELGMDYPRAYVRWTENRNMQAFLQLLATGSLRTDLLPVETLPFEEAEAAYARLAKGEGGALATIFRYPDEPSSRARSLPMSEPSRRAFGAGIGIGFVGAGNYARGVLLPAVQRVASLELRGIATATGASARHTAQRFGFRSCGTDPDEVLGDQATDLVFVATRHDTHAALAVRALEAGKAVWLEKPVGLSMAEVRSVVEAARKGGPLMVGFNRRFSSHARRIREAFERRASPITVTYQVSAGPPPTGTWIMDASVGGGRVVGEVCHFVDLATFLVGAPPVAVQARRPSHDAQRDDSCVALLDFPDGSVAQIAYLASASPEVPKERFDVSGGGRTFSCDNFRSTREAGGRPFRSRGQDKGQTAALEDLARTLRENGRSPIPLEEIEAVSVATLALERSLATGRPVRLGDMSEEETS